MKNNTILVGLMGAGKTTIGRLLAEKLNYKFIDVDDEIVKQESMSINEIFLLKSEEYFRKIETQILSKICKQDDCVISTGGGAFEREENRNILLNNGKVFYLYADIDTIFERIKDDDSRPLLREGNPKIVLNELLIKREENYKKAHYTIDTTQNLEEIIDKIISKL